MKLMKNALMLSLIASLLISAFAFAPVFADEASLKAPTIRNPLQEPGTEFTFQVMVDDVVHLKFLELKLAFETSFLTPTYVAGVLGAPVWFDTVSSEINDAMGYVSISCQRREYPAGSGIDYFDTTVPLPAVSVTFHVDGRGTSPLDLQDTVLKNNLGEPITHTAIDGLFDNRLEGMVIAPNVLDETLEPGSYFDVFVCVDDVTHLWGYQFVMSFDPAYLYIDNFERLAPFTMNWPSEMGSDYVSIAASYPFGEHDGLSTTEPVAVARIGFYVQDYTTGTPLDLHDVVLTNTGGAKLYVGVEDGSFANVIPNAQIALDTGFVEARKFHVSDNPMTLTAQIKNEALDHGRLVKAAFTVMDADGNVAGYLETIGYIAPGTMIRLSADLDVTGLGYPASYSVIFEALYITTMGWTVANKGSPGAARFEMEKSFNLLP